MTADTGGAAGTAGSGDGRSPAVPARPVTPVTPINDAERAQVTELLRVHTADGRLTLDEFSERVGVALAAQSREELDRVVADLPVPWDAAVPAAVDGSEPAEATRRRRATRWVVAVMSGAARKGRWRTAGMVTAVAVMGGCEVDLRRAEIEGPEVIINAIAVMGGVDVIVPEGIEVELTGFPIMGGKHMKVADVPILPGSPRVVVRAFPIMGGVTVRSKPHSKPRGEDDRRHGSRGRRSRVDTPQAPAPGAVPAPPAPPALPPRTGDDLAARLQRDLSDAIEQGMRVAERHMPPREAEKVRRHAERLQRQAQRHAERWDQRWGMPVEEEEEASLPSDNELASVPTAPDGTVTIMFSDICGYTEMTEAHGDFVTRDVLRTYQQIVRGQLAAFGGYEVKTQGDGFMVAFGGASRALRCAIAIQRAFEGYNIDHTDIPILVHQGLHTGETLQDGGDFLGRTVIVASRITGVAGQGEILVSSLLKELADGTKEFSFGPSRLVELKGLSNHQTLYPVEWRPAAGP